MQIGNNLLSAATEVTLGGLADSGEIQVTGNSGGSNQATLDVLAAARATLTDTLDVSGDALVEFASGSVTSIASGAELILDGPQARVADAGATTTAARWQV